MTWNASTACGHSYGAHSLYLFTYVVFLSAREQQTIAQ